MGGDQPPDGDLTGNIVGDHREDRDQRETVRTADPLHIHVKMDVVRIVRIYCLDDLQYIVQRQH